MRVFVHNFIRLACETGDELHEVVLALYKVGLCDNLVFQWLHRRNNRVDVVDVGVVGGGLESQFVFSVIVFVEFLILYLADTRNVFQVVFKLLFHKLHKILSRHLILDIKLCLHFIQECLLDCVGAILACETGHCGAAAADVACDIPRGFHR